MVSINNLEIVYTAKPTCTQTILYKVMLDADIIISTIFKEYTGKPPVYTSIQDGKHKQGSMHYLNLARDIRSRDLSPQIKDRILKDMICRLQQYDPHFDVIWESNLFNDKGEQIRWEHFHIEFDINKR